MTLRLFMEQKGFQSQFFMKHHRRQSHDDDDDGTAVVSERCDADADPSIRFKEKQPAYSHGTS